MPPVVLVVIAIASVQVGAALSKSLFDEIGPGGTVFVRVAAAALVLALVWRPRIAGRSRRELGLILPFAAVLAGMNLAFYAALERLPLGIAVTFEFVGPLGVAVLGSRKPRRPGLGGARGGGHPAPVGLRGRAAWTGWAWHWPSPPASSGAPTSC